MLYYLFDLLQDTDFPGARLFTYVSFRALLAIVISLIISTWVGSSLINYFKKKQITETLRDFDKNNLKAGVPTMGGIIIITVIAIALPVLAIPAETICVIIRGNVFNCSLKIVEPGCKAHISLKAKSVKVNTIGLIMGMMI